MNNDNLSPFQERIVQAAELAVAQFSAEWEKSPYRWLQEIDVQVDLVAKIKRIISSTFAPEELKHALTVMAPLTNAIGGDTSPQILSRITCEPTVVPFDDIGSIKPDIVIWDDRDNADGYINDGRWPIIWACEIKYTTKEYDTTDYPRLKRLVTGDRPLAKRAHLLSLCWGMNPPSLNNEYPGLISTTFRLPALGKSRP